MNVKQVVWGLLWLACSAQAQVKVVTPTGDMTQIKWGKSSISMLRTVFDINNAHNVEHINFFIPNPRGAATQLAFETGGMKYVPALALRGGADCMLSSIKVLMRGEAVQVVYAERKGEWFDEKKFDFTIYELIKGESGVPGFPDVYFKSVKKVSTAKNYCDANIALDKESKLYQ